MQVLEQKKRYDPIQHLWNILNLQQLPYFDPTKVIKNEIRGLSQFELLLDDIISQREIESQSEEQVEEEVSESRSLGSREPDSRADPIMVQLSETCDEALEAYKSWRSPRFVGRFKIDGKIEEQRDEFARFRTKIFARDIGRSVDRLISLGYNPIHFTMIVLNAERKQVKRTYSDIIAEIEKADIVKAPELLSELITCVKIILPVNPKYEEVHVISPSMPDVANVKEQTA